MTMSDMQFTMVATLGAISLMFVLLTIGAAIIHFYHNMKDLKQRHESDMDEYHRLVQSKKLTPEEAYRKAMK